MILVAREGAAPAKDIGAQSAADFDDPRRPSASRDIIDRQPCRHRAAPGRRSPQAASRRHRADAEDRLPPRASAGGTAFVVARAGADFAPARRPHPRHVWPSPPVFSNSTGTPEPDAQRRSAARARRGAATGASVPSSSPSPPQRAGAGRPSPKSIARRGVARSRPRLLFREQGTRAARLSRAAALARSVANASSATCATPITGRRPAPGAP